MPPFDQNPEAIDRTCRQRGRAMKTGSSRGRAVIQCVSRSAESADAFQRALTGTRYPIEDRTHLPVPDTGQGISPRSRCRLQPSRCARARGSRRSRLVPDAAPGRIKVLAGDEAGEARWHASALKGVHHVAILVDDGSCDGAGENSANVRYEMGDVL